MKPSIEDTIKGQFPPNLRWRHVVQIARLYGFERHDVLTLSASLPRHYFVRGRKLAAPPSGRTLRAYYDRDSAVKLFAPSNETR